jgi:adenylate kinase family enzyme
LPPVTSQPGHRIAVIGTSGAGKTYVAEALAAKLGIPYVCNDAIIWRPDWIPTPRDQRAEEMELATRGDAWTFDGNLFASNAEDVFVLERCDTIVWLDLPRRQVWSQVLWRTLRGLITRKPHWRNGNVERWRVFFSSESIVWWSVKTFSTRRRQYAALFADPINAGRTLIRLKSRREVDAWLSGVEAEPVAHGMRASTRNEVE